MNWRGGVYSGIFDEPVCEDVVVEDGGLLTLLVEIEEKAVGFVGEPVVS